MLTLLLKICPLIGETKDTGGIVGRGPVWGFDLSIGGRRWRWALFERTRVEEEEGAYALEVMRSVKSYGQRG